VRPGGEVVTIGEFKRRKYSGTMDKGNIEVTPRSRGEGVYEGDISPSKEDKSGEESKNRLRFLEEKGEQGTRRGYGKGYKYNQPCCGPLSKREIEKERFFFKH